MHKKAGGVVDVDDGMAIEMRVLQPCFFRTTTPLMFIYVW